MDILISWLQQGVSTVVPFVILLGILIFVHELGHFLVARWCGVRVEVFSLGFGKKIFSFKRGDTTYALSMIPLGGYVKMFGEQPGESITEADKKYSFTHKNVFKRIAIVLAGPVMNFLFAVLVFSLLSMMGEEARRPLLGDISQGSNAYNLGLRSGDLILRAGDKEIKTYEEFAKIMNQNKGRDLPLELDRMGNAVSLKVPVTAASNPNILSHEETIGEVEGLTLSARGTFVGLDAASPLYSAGLRTGDRIKSINGQKVSYWRDLDTQLKAISPNSALTLEIERYLDDHYEKMETMTLTFAGGRVKEYSLKNLMLESSELYLSRVVQGSPAQEGGLQRGDRLLSIGGQAVENWEQVVSLIKSFDGNGTMDFAVMRESQTLQMKIKPLMTVQQTAMGTEDKRFTIGVVPMANFSEPDIVLVKSKDIGSAFQRGFTRTADVSLMMVMSFVRLIENKISAKNIGGVISIGQAARDTFKLGLDKFLQMMAFISVNLFILNLLPIPVLDGGHLVFYVIEAVKGSPLSLKKMEYAQRVGLVLLMSLMVFALYNDFIRLISKS